MAAGLQNRKSDDVQFWLCSALTKTMLLGNVAYRSGMKLEWDGAALKARNSP